MTGPNHLLTSLLFPALGGAAVGFIAGVFVTLYWVGRCRERGQTVPTYRDDVDPETGEPLHRKRPWHGSEHLSRLGVTLLVLSLLGLIAGVVSLVQTNQQAGCLANFVAANVQISKERAQAYDTDRQSIRIQREVTRDQTAAVKKFLTTDFHGDTAAYQAAKNELLATYDAGDAKLAEVDQLDQDAEAQRQQNPLPPQPNC